MTGRLTVLALSCAFLGGAIVLTPAQQKAKPQPVTFKKDIKPLIDKHCIKCHGGDDPVAGLSLEKYKTEKSMVDAADIWRNVARNIASGHMPPKGMAQPPAAQKKKLVAAIETLLAVSCDIKDPGRVTLRRLNRAEYNNTVRDLVGVNFRPADDFPSDDVGYGFDNIGDVLSLSPLLMEKYLSAAEEIANKAIVVGSNKPIKIPAVDLEDVKGASSMNGGKRLGANCEVKVEPTLAKAGLYKMRVRAYGEQAGDAAPSMALRQNGKDLKVFDVKAVREKPEIYEVPFTGAPGKNQLGIAFLNDFYDGKRPIGDRDRNLMVFDVEIVGPLTGDNTLPVSHRRVMIADPAVVGKSEAARKILANFATRAYRRPVTKDETDRLMKLFEMSQKANEPFERGIQYGMQAVLVSPHFLFRVEVDPKDGKKERPVNNYELASRLSYFLWSSMPDARLMQLAGQGKLQKPETLRAEVKRMLKDPKAHALADNFAEQWLQLRKIHTFTPNPNQFPMWNDDLRQAMVTETKKFFQAMIDEDRNIVDFLDGKFTYVNEPLAKLYGLKGVTGEEFRRVSLEGTHRGGVLTQASVLSITSNPTRTSPVKRGKWVLEQILGTPPPPPPPGVGDLEDTEGKVIDGKTLRKRLEQHRSKPDCASCHQRMDPIGFGMENFDPIGRWRTKEDSTAIDNSGTLPDGRSFKGPNQLKKILIQDQKQFVHTLADRLLTYGLGRGLQTSDKCSVDTIVEQVGKQDNRFSALIVAVVESDPFRKRRSEAAK
jgi:hypothetical protein